MDSTDIPSPTDVTNTYVCLVCTAIDDWRQLVGAKPTHADVLMLGERIAFLQRSVPDLGNDYDRCSKHIDDADKPTLDFKCDCNQCSKHIAYNPVKKPIPRCHHGHIGCSKTHTG